MLGTKKCTPAPCVNMGITHSVLFAKLMALRSFIILLIINNVFFQEGPIEIKINLFFQGVQALVQF